MPIVMNFSSGPAVYLYLHAVIAIYLNTTSVVYVSVLNDVGIALIEMPMSPFLPLKTNFTIK